MMTAVEHVDRFDHKIAGLTGDGLRRERKDVVWRPLWTSGYRSHRLTA